MIIGEYIMDKSQLVENTRRFRKTKKGLLTNLYHKMKSRHPVDFTLHEFHEIFLDSKLFNRLFTEWEKSKYNKLKKPSIDRINNKVDYLKSNIHMITWAENRYKQTMERRSRKGGVLHFVDDRLVAIYRSQRETVLKTGFNQGCISEVLNGIRPHSHGSVFKWENPELLKKLK